MNKFNLLILICSFLLCSVLSYAQHNHPTGQYNDGSIAFEFVLELIYSDNGGVNQNNVIGIEINVTNIGESSINKDILFQIYISDAIPLEMPDTYDAERVLELSKNPLGISHSANVFIPLTVRRDKVITIWPLVDSSKSASKQDVSYITTLVPSGENSVINNVPSGMNVYPNPTRGNLHIVTLADSQTLHQITIHNKTGQAIKTFNKVISGTLTLDLNDLSPDIYFITIRDENAQIIHRSKLILDK